MPGRWANTGRAARWGVVLGLAAAVSAQAAALLLLLKTDATPAQARGQLGLRYGHVAAGPTWVMLKFFDLYDDWLRRQGRAHTPAALREWADHGYCPGNVRGRLELLEA